MSEALTFIQSLVPASHAVQIAIASFGLSTSVVLQFIKHIGKLQDAKKIVMLLLAGLSIVVTLAAWIVTGHQSSGAIDGTSAATFLGWIVVAATYIHRFAVSPAYHKIVDDLNAVLAKAAAYDALQTITPTAKTAQTLSSLPTTSTTEQHEFTINQ